MAVTAQEARERAKVRLQSWDWPPQPPAPERVRPQGTPFHTEKAQENLLTGKRGKYNPLASDANAMQLPLVTPTAYDRGIARWGHMRFLGGIILGAVLTIVGVYIVDMQTDGVEQRHMVNWDVVGERLNQLTAGAQRVWADFTREITGPT